MIVASHDELCLDPMTNFQALTERIGLRWSPAMERYIVELEDPKFTVHHGTVNVHPNAVTATTSDSRREQQATQFTRRLTPEQAAEARSRFSRRSSSATGVPNQRKDSATSCTRILAPTRTLP